MILQSYSGRPSSLAGGTRTCGVPQNWIFPCGISCMRYTILNRTWNIWCQQPIQGTCGLFPGRHYFRPAECLFENCFCTLFCATLWQYFLWKGGMPVRISTFVSKNAARGHICSESKYLFFSKRVCISIHSNNLLSECGFLHLTLILDSYFFSSWVYSTLSQASMNPKYLFMSSGIAPINFLKVSSAPQVDWGYIK